MRIFREFKFYNLLVKVILIAYVGILSDFGISYALDIQEQALKAVYLFNFSKYSTWVDEAKKEKNLTKVRFCIYQSSDIYEELKKAENRTINGLSIEVIKLENLNSIVKESNYCQVLYAPDLKALEEVEGLSAKDRVNMLLVSEEGGSGLINFIKKDSHLGFSVNFDSLSKSNIILSSELLKLAAPKGSE